MHKNSVTLCVRMLLILSIAAFAAFYVADSIRWPMVEDAPIMHYVNFLMEHGMHPYSDITDNNMPGAYLTEGVAMHLFGGTDVAWRIYDFALLAAMGLAFVIIARPDDWLAGYLAWGMFVLVHASDGPRYTGQREEVIAVLLLAGFAALFEAVRRDLPSLCFLFGLGTSLAATIKPTFIPLPVVVLALTVWTLRRHRLPTMRLIAWTVAGASVTTALILAFLLYHRALGPFFFILSTITPAYRAVWPASTFALIVRAYPLPLLPVLMLALALRSARHPPKPAPVWQRRWEDAALLVAALAGLASYYIQHKGFYHHRYTWLAFCFLLCALHITRALQVKAWRHHAALAALLFFSFVCVPWYARLTGRFSRGEDATVALQQNLEAGLEHDLTQLTAGETGKLQRQVLCFDLVSGCLSALYHLRLVEHSGFTGDLLFFRQPATASTLFYRDLFWQRARQNPPNVLIVTTEWFGEQDSFEKIETWPDFARYVQTNYVQVSARQFAATGIRQPSDGRAYRIYRRKEAASSLTR